MAMFRSIRFHSHTESVMITFAIVSLLVLIGLDDAKSVFLVQGYNINDTTVKPSTLSCPGALLLRKMEAWVASVEMICLDWYCMCDQSTFRVQLHLCYCMTLYAKDSNVTVVGPCMHKCHYYTHPFGHIMTYYPIPDNMRKLSNYTCSIIEMVSCVESVKKVLLHQHILMTCIV